jgi:hypothetical protein
MWRLDGTRGTYAGLLVIALGVAVVWILVLNR